MVEEHKEEMYFLLRLLELPVGLVKIIPVLEVALSFLMQEFDHTNRSIINFNLPPLIKSQAYIHSHK